MSRDEMRDWYGWTELDVLLVSGDAYVDHPSFGIAVIGRVLAADGLRVGIVAQPQSLDDVLALGRPRFFVGVSAGNLDSMLNRYTAARRLRSDDHYSPGGQAGLRPDRACIPYTALVKQAFPGVPVVLGGIEASLRRFVHHDHWSRTARRSILADSKADLLVYGMGETAVRIIARRLAAGEPVQALTDLPGTCHLHGQAAPATALTLASFEDLRRDPGRWVETTQAILREQDPLRGRPLVQDQGWCRLVQNPPALPLTMAELDAVHDLPFIRRAHPGYAQGVPALETVKHSIITHRGCSGSCAFCSLGTHQGRIIASRSVASIRREAGRIAADPGFHGTIDDVGGATANMYGATCARWGTVGACADHDCLWPEVCPNYRTDPRGHLAMLEAVRSVPGVRHVHIQSGIRHDLAVKDGQAWLAPILRHYVSGRMKVAPESADDRVLALMKKPAWKTFRQFQRLYDDTCAGLNRQAFLVPYLISGHPGAELAGTCEAAARLREAGLEPDQIQEFIATPLTLATAMQVASTGPDGTPLAIIDGDRDRRTHKALLHSSRPQNRGLVLQALKACGKNHLARLLTGQEGLPGALQKNRATPSRRPHPGRRHR